MQILVSVQSPSCKPQPYRLPRRLGTVWNGELALGPPQKKLQARGHISEEGVYGRKGKDTLCAKVSDGYPQ